MIVECPRCKSRYDSTLHKPGAQISCRCGQAFYTPTLPKLAKSSNCPNCGGAASPDQNKCNYCGVYLSFARCPACFSIAPYQGAKFCAECGDPLNTPAKRTSDANKNFPCPRCKSINLERKTVGDHTIDSCPQCSGIWLDHTVLDQLLIKSNQKKVSKALLGQAPVKIANLKRHKVTYLPCPECEELMHRRNFPQKSGVIVDECTAHGIWFDKHELAAAIQFVRISPEKIEHKVNKPPSAKERLKHRVHLRDNDRIEITSNGLEALFKDFPMFFM